MCFDGAGTTPFAPDHPTGPLGAYGRSKLTGEAGRAGGGRGAHVILRTSWVFSAHGSNFVKTMLRLWAAAAQLTVVADQIGGPTPAAAIAAAACHRDAPDPSKPAGRHLPFRRHPRCRLGRFRPRDHGRRPGALRRERHPDSGLSHPGAAARQQAAGCAAACTRFGLPRPTGARRRHDVLDRTWSMP